MQTPTLGALPSGPDYRDAIAALAAVTPSAPVTLPAQLHTNLGGVLMQGQQPACVSHSIAKLMKLYWFLKTGVWVDLSPRFLDILSAEPDIPLDGGRRPRTVLKIGVTVGCCTTATLSNDVTLSIADYRNASAVTAEARAEALKYRIPGFLAVPTTFAATRMHTWLYGAVSALLMVGKELWTPSWEDSAIDPLRTPAVVESGHEMTITGWDKPNLNIIENEWSSAWANQGSAEYDPIAWDPYTVEQWAIAEIPQDIVDFLKNLPSPVNFHYAWNNDLHQGDQNSSVEFAQTAFMILGYLAPIAPGELGIFGPKTAAANAKFQSANGIVPVPGSIGPATRKALNAKFSL